MENSTYNQPTWDLSSAATHRVKRLLSLTVWFAAAIGLATGLAHSVAIAEQLPADLWTRSAGSDWPSFLGPQRNSVSPETGILTDWDACPPRILWTTELGEGFGIGSVSRGRFFQLDRQQDRARLRCLHAETGRLLWTYEYETDYVDFYGYNGGPRCSPIIDGPRVYICDAKGLLQCLQVADGKLIWKCDTAERFGIIQNFFGVGSTPIIEQDQMIAIVGGSPTEDQKIAPGRLDRVHGNGSAIVAFNKYTGQVNHAISDELAGYASPVITTIKDRRWCFAFCRGGLVAFNPTNFEADFHFPWRARIRESVNASTPVVVGDEVFISETYGPGSALLRVTPGDYQVVWQDAPRQRHRAMQAHWNTPIYYQGYLYGCSGRNPRDAQLRCIDWNSGKIMWSQPEPARSSLLYVDRHAACLTETGELSLIRLNPNRCDRVTSLTWPDSATPSPSVAREPRTLLKYPCWSAPILSHGLLYVRGRNRLVCLELIPEKAPSN